jgi:hypothetical protein
MPYRDLAPRRAAPLPPTPLLEHAMLWLFVALSPWIVPATILKDSFELLRLATLPPPLDAGGRAALCARLALETPTWVRRFVSTVYTIASGEEEVWHVLAIRFADGSEDVVCSFTHPSASNDGARVLAAIPPRRMGRYRDPIDEESILGLPSLAIFLSLLPMAIWALALAIVVVPVASLAVLLPLPITLALHALSRWGARHVIPRELP